ncbi:oxidative damage protection protein [Enterobacteriaceae endosymbiont of Donacia tomentosa]|uniref:oxidative damage protection protein n=1 Tax=Enterobacteriaceae endosymbiont of Donacia tomentosa TaxID=2675787 RepID=UPI00144A0553|nr:oxidative damage protection protein [Enterobacteriaceae endosymbiont of Donacia tomentosa]QJC31718.1 oxidative damage protection protein [Enterobacteriaceae endosymbiont of Donacia tomentosa]
MPKTIFCVYYQSQKEGLNNKVYPGNIGEIIFFHISKKAWRKWLINQTKLINEKKLNMTIKKHILFLEREMINFLFKHQKK